MGGPFIMAREKKPVYRVQMTEGKCNIIHQLLEKSSGWNDQGNDGSRNG